MSEQFILGYLPARIKQLGYSTMHMHYRDMLVHGGEVIGIPAYNELFFIVDSPQGFRIISDYGLYDTAGEYPPHDNVHEHRGYITIMNAGNTQWIKMIQVILVN